MCARSQVSLGRRSKRESADVDLGDQMNVSRKHAVIRYSFERARFELQVLGKNGAFVKGCVCSRAAGARACLCARGCSRSRVHVETGAARHARATLTRPSRPRAACARPRSMLVTPEMPPVELKSRDLVQVGQESFFFLLPSKR